MTCFDSKKSTVNDPGGTHVSTDTLKQASKQQRQQRQGKKVMSSHPKAHQNLGAADADQQERALTATAPPSSASPPASAGSVVCVDGCRVVEFDMRGTVDQLIKLLSPFKERRENVHLKLTNAKKLTQFEWFSSADLSAVDVSRCVVSIDLSSLSEVEKIPSRFVSEFNGESVDLTPLGSVTEIGDYFLYRSGLVQLDLSPLRNVRSVGEAFLTSMESLKTIDLSPLSKLPCIPDSMLYWCKNLTTVNVHELNKVQKIGNSLCCGCSSLRHLDFNGMNSVTEIGNEFCCECWHLESIDLSGFSNLQCIGYDFLKSCSRLKHVDLSAMQNLEEVGSDFLWQRVYNEERIDGDTRVRSSLASINMSGLRKLKKIGWGFLSGCCSLTHVDLSAMQNLEEVGAGFLLDCSSLKSINMKGLSKLTSVGVGFLCDASSFEHLDLSGCVSLTHIGESFCEACSSLQSVNLANVEKVSEIEYRDSFFKDCPKLSTVIGLPDCIRDKLPKDHPVRKHGQRYWRMFALLIREKSRGHVYDAFQIWNVMRFVAEFL